MKITSNQPNALGPSMSPSVDHATKLATDFDNDPPNSLLSASQGKSDDDKVKKAFQDFVGQTFFGQMIASMRATQGETPYFNGGRAEKIFQGQLDQKLTEELSNSSASQFADPMYKLFQMHRS
jgi:peptidoglycan hydrolase FlgJ